MKRAHNVRFPILAKLAFVGSLGLLASAAHAVDIASLPYYISEPGTYTLTSDLQQIGSTAISITASDVILDLGGYTLSGTGGYKGGYGYGIGVSPGVSGVTIRNGTIAEFEIEVGIMLHQVTGCTVSNVTVRECGGGIAVIDGGGHTIENCTLDHNVHANMSLGNASGNIVEGNTCLGAGWSMRLGGSSSGNSLLFNTCDGSSAGAIDLTGADGNILIGNTTTNAWIGIYGETSDANLLDDNTATGCAQGITLHGDTNTLMHNTTTGNAETGFFLSGTGNTVQNNTANGNGTGFYLPIISGSTVRNNTANGNVYDGIIVWSSSGPCGGNTLQHNTAMGNGASGIRVNLCGNNTIKGNTTSNNATYGIVVTDSSGNDIHKNTALGNSVDLVDSTCDDNLWRKNIFVTSSGACVVPDSTGHIID